MVAESRPRPVFRPELLVTPENHQIVTDALIKRFGTAADRDAAYRTVRRDLNAPPDSVPPPYEGEPTEVWDGTTWKGIDIWQGRSWKPLRQPLPGQEGLIIFEVDDAERVVPEPGVGDPRQYLTFTVTLIGEPREHVSVDFLSEERDPRSVADRARKNPDGTDFFPNPDPGGARLGIDFANISGTLVFDPNNRAADDFGDRQTFGDGRVGYLSNPQRLQVEVFPDIEAGEGVERMQLRLHSAIRGRIDRPIGIGIIASEQQPVVRIYDTSVETEHAPAQPGQPRQIRPTTAYFRVEITKGGAANPITFTARTGDITATAGQDYVALDGSTTYTIPAGNAGTSILIPVTIPAQPTEGFERFSITLGNLSDEAVFATQYAECTIRGTPADPFFGFDFVTFGALFLEPEPDIITIPYRVIPAPTATTVIEYWTFELQRTNQVRQGALDYEVISQSNRRTLTISPGTTYGTIRLRAYLFGIRRRQLEQDAKDAAAGRPVPARPEVDIVFAFLARRRSGANLAGIDNDTRGSGQRSGQVELGLVATTGRTATPQIRISTGRPRTGTETEGDQPSENIQARFPISISFSPTRAISIQASTATGGSFGTAEAGLDFVAKTQTIQWGIGDTVLTKYFDVDIVEETLAEPAETFTALISNVQPANAAEITTDRATYTIEGETAPGTVTPPNVSIESADIRRPNPGTVRQLSFPVSISKAAAAGGARVDVEVVAGTARANTDYRTTAQPASGFAGTASSLSWAEGEDDDRTVDVLIPGGDNPTRPLQFFVRLSNPSGVRITRASAIGTITARPTPDDPTGPGPTDPIRRLPEVAVADSSRPEDHTTGYIQFAVTLNRQPAAGQTATVTYITQGLADCVAGEDYDLYSPQASSAVTQTRATSGELQGRISFSGAQVRHVVRIAVINDDDVEVNEQFELRLSNPVNCDLDPNAATAIGTITSEDQPPVVRARPDVSISAGRIDGRFMRFTIELSHTTATAVTGQIYTTNGTALSGQDFFGIARTRPRRWTIPANTLRTSIPITLIEPIGDSNNENFTATITNISDNASLIGRRATGTGTIPARQTVAPTNQSLLNLELVSSPANRGDNATVAVTRTGSTTNPVGATLSISGVGGTTIGTASNADLRAYSRVVSLGRGIRRNQVNIPTLVPGSDQPTEQFDARITLPSGTAARLGTNTSVRVNLPEYQVPVVLILGAPIITLGSSRGLLVDSVDASAAFPVFLSRPATRNVNFRYSVRIDGTYDNPPVGTRTLPVTVSCIHSFPAGSTGGLVVMDSGVYRGRSYIPYRLGAISRLFTIVTSIIASLGIVTAAGSQLYTIGNYTFSVGAGTALLPTLSGVPTLIGASAGNFIFAITIPALTGAAAVSSSIIFSAVTNAGSGLRYVSNVADLTNNSVIGLGTSSLLSSTQRASVFEALNLTALSATITISNISGADNTGTATATTRV